MVAEIESEWYGGEIVGIKRKAAIIQFDDGDEFEIDLADLHPEDVGDDEEPSFTFDPQKPGSKGAEHCYPITWDKRGYSFECFASLEEEDKGLTSVGDNMIGRTVKFFGSFDRVRVKAARKSSKNDSHGWCINIHAEIDLETGQRSTLVVDPIVYNEVDLADYADPSNKTEVILPDPRKTKGGMARVNSDICMAIRKWLFLEAAAMGGIPTIKQLIRKANCPSISFTSIDHLDLVITRLKELRATALRSGGQRSLTIDPEKESDPALTIHVDFTSQGMVLEGKVPAVGRTAGADGAVQTRGKKSRQSTVSRELNVVADPENVAALKSALAEYNLLAKKGDANAKSEARKIRATLRKMGITGGARSA